MNRILGAVCLVGLTGLPALAALSTHVLPTNDSARPVRISYGLEKLVAENEGDGFHRLVADPDLAAIGEEGAPELYSTGVLLAVPEGFEPELHVLSREEDSLPGIVVRPHQKHSRCATPNQFQFQASLYASSTVYPSAEPVQIEEAGRLQGLRLIRVAVTPFQMDFGQGRVRVTRSLNAEVRFRSVRNASTLLLPRQFYRSARAFLPNLSSLETQVRPAPTPDIMLIFVADELAGQMAPLVRWQREKGIQAKVMTFTEAGGTREKIKEIIQQHYDNPALKPTYLLFVGNARTMPGYVERVTFQGQLAVTDYPFSLLSGSDIIPDVLYGRIVADNASELTTQVTRWIDYEKNPERSDWYAQAATIASDQDGPGPSDEEYSAMIQASLKGHTYKAVDQFYQSKGNATFTNISAALAQGRSWLTYIGHGSGTSWGNTNGTFDVSSVDKLNNTGRLPILIDVACLNADYRRIPRPFGKAWVTHAVNGRPAGAVAYYGGSVSISWDPPAVMSTGIAKYHAEKSIMTLGGSVLAGQMYLIEKIGAGKDAKDNLLWYNLFGDPSLLVRTAEPKPFDVRFGWSAREEDDETITVFATDAQDQGVKGLRAALADSEREEVLAVGRTGEEGRVSLRVPSSARNREWLLTITGYNAMTYQRPIRFR